MRIVRYNLHSERPKLARLGALLGDGQVVDLRAAYARMLTEQGEAKAYEFSALRFPENVIGFLAGGVPAREAVAKVFDWATALATHDGQATGVRGEALFTLLSECRLHAPIRSPKLIIARFPEAGSAPEITAKPIGTVVGPTRNIIPPQPDARLRCAAGIALVVGRTLTSLEPDMAWQAVAGYALMTDVSLATSTADGGHFTSSMYQSFAPCGPWLTLGSRTGPTDAEIILSINDHDCQRFALADLSWTVGRTLAYLAPMGFDPGDTIWIGPAAAPEARVGLGDVVTTRSQRLGMLRNSVALSQPPN